MVQRGACQNQQAQIGIFDAGGACRHGHQRVAGHARRGIDFEQEGHLVAGAQHDVDAAPAPAAQGAVGVQHLLLDGVLHLLGQAAGAGVLHGIAEVFVLVVIVALRRHDAHQRQGLGVCARADHRAGELVAHDQVFAQYGAVHLRHVLQGFAHAVGIHGLDYADGGAFMRRLDDHGQAQMVDHALDMFFLPLPGCQFHIARGGDAFGQPDALGHGFVHGHCRCHDARAGVRNAHQLQRALHCAVFAKAAMQGDEAAGKALLFQGE